MARLTVTWQLCFLYAVGFGGFVAFSVYLPAYLRTAYGLTPNDAALRTAGFVVLAVIMRPIGGWLSDRLHPVPVLVWCFSGTALLAIVQAFQPLLSPSPPSPSSAWPPCSAPPAARSSPSSARSPRPTRSARHRAGRGGRWTRRLPTAHHGLGVRGRGLYAIGLMLLSDVALAAASTPR